MRAGGRLSTGQLHLTLVPAADEHRAVVDLRRAEWVEPIGLVAAAAFAERAAAGGRSVLLLRPEHDELAHYLARMRLGLTLEALGQEHDLPAVDERDAGSRLVELTRFTGAREPDELGLMLLDRTAAVPALADALHQCVAEIGANVPEHSGRDWGYVAAQTTVGDTVVQFAVGDAGDGVAAGFATHVRLSDAEAVEWTLERGVSRTGLPGRGRGLQKAKALVTSLGGQLHMLSGTAFRTVQRDSSTHGEAERSWSGTLLQGSFPLPIGTS